MSTTIDPLIPVIKAENPKLYFAEDVILSGDTIDPLSRVVPCFTDKRLFFGSFVCNIVVFTKLLLNGSSNWDAQVNLTKAMLIEMFPRFARYELHFWIDGGATDVLAAATVSKAAFENKLIALAVELASYNVFYHGKKQSDQLKTEIDGVLQQFKAAI